MDIETTDFDTNYHGSDVFSCISGDYERHNVDVFNSLSINGVSHNAVYQTGCSFLHNDYSCPSPYLELSIDGGSSELLTALDSIYESELDRDLFGFDEELEEYSCEQIREMWFALRDNTHAAKSEFENLIIAISP